MTFDLHGVVRAALEGSSDADPHDVAEELARTFTPSQARKALAEALPPFVVKVATYMRTSHHHPLVDETSTAPSSRRWDQVRAHLVDRVHSDCWKFLADCTSADLRMAADRKRRLAAGLLAEAERYEKLAAVLDESDGHVVRDLDLDVIGDVFE